jgi:hypothetical protein
MARTESEAEVTEADVTKKAQEFIDSALAARGRLGYSTRVSKKSYGRAVSQAALVFQTLQGTNAERKAHPSPPAR